MNANSGTISLSILLFLVLLLSSNASLKVWAGFEENNQGSIFSFSKFDCSTSKR